MGALEAPVEGEIGPGEVPTIAPEASGEPDLSLVPSSFVNPTCLEPPLEK